MKYVLGIDQSTQGTKAVLFDESGKASGKALVPHRQIVSDRGWVSHDLNEIYDHTVRAVKDVIETSGVQSGDIVCVGVANQRETTGVWDKDGKPLSLAVVWQCGRAEGIAKRLAPYGERIAEKTGLPLSPFFPAAKMRWLIENTPLTRDFCMGTVDSWLIRKLTGERLHKTDISNASRTQLFDIHTLKWDEDLCGLFGVPMDALPEACDSDAFFGETDIEGALAHKVPILAALGDSHAALYGQGCHKAGTAKATYGTGSSVVMNMGEKPVQSARGLTSSVAWRAGGRVAYILEGNIHYAGAVVTWLKDNLRLIASAREAETLAEAANPNDQTILIPAFTGLGAPYWKNDARASFSGMSRTTGRAELVRAGLDAIAYQVTDVVNAMAADSGLELRELRADGGPTKNGYLMRLQSALIKAPVRVTNDAEISAAGAAFMAGIKYGVYSKDVFGRVAGTTLYPEECPLNVSDGLERWRRAVRDFT